MWAGSLVLSSFMAGLALGNSLAGRYGDRLSNPIRTYAMLELLIGVAGLSVVVLLNVLNESLAPLFRQFLGSAVSLNMIRLTIGFLLLLLPTVAMGATLPVMVKGLMLRDVNFGSVLGLVYGWNTMGAVLGAVVGELFLIGSLGIFGTGVVAALGNLFAGGIAFLLDRIVNEKARETDSLSVEPRSMTWSVGGKRLLAAAFLSGALLLALEVVWFRFLLLYVLGTSLTFAIMLAVVLAGIGLGGLLASRLAGFRSSSILLPMMPLVCGMLIIVTYSAFVSGPVTLEYVDDGRTTLNRAVWLVFPACVASGILFTLLGEALHRKTGAASRSAGWLTLSNTTGSMFGAMAGGFLLIPQLGVERSFFWLAMAYGLVSLLVLPRALFENMRRAILVVAVAVAFVVAMSWFPDGSLHRHTLQTIHSRFSLPNTRVVAYREGLTETVVYLQTDMFGEPLRHKLITNGHSMAGTGVHSSQYMKMFVYLPVALHPKPRRALLVSFGCGVTARALTDTRELEHIDVVDISRDILELNDVVYPAPETRPLNDARVEVHIEDGRFFLQTTGATYDLITGEPPPPRAAGVVNLYTQEYFQLIYNRLAPGGMTTYWLPLHNLSQSDGRAIVRAFCNVFNDCSLWMGSGEDLILLGVREGGTRVSAERFAAQWRNPVVEPELKRLGFEFPEQLGAYFIADGLWLRDLVKESPPLVDNFPHRLSPRLMAKQEDRYASMIDPAQSAQRFHSSQHIDRLWPASIKEDSLKFFDFRYQIHDHMSESRQQLAPENRRGLAGLHHLLTASTLQTPVLWMLNTQVRELQILEKSPMRAEEVGVCYHRRGDRAMSRRDYSQAVTHYLHARQLDPDRRVNYCFLDMFALCMAGQNRKAQNLANEIAASIGPVMTEQSDWQFLAQKFGLSDPTELFPEDR